MGVRTASIWARHGLIQFKVLHGLHFSEVNSKMFPDTPVTSVDSHLHLYYLLILAMSLFVYLLEFNLQNTVRYFQDGNSDGFCDGSVFGIVGENSYYLIGNNLKITKVVTFSWHRD